jgi:transketolase
VFAEKVENMIVSSADLSNSDKTDAFLKKSSIFRKKDFSGGFLQSGVSELTMAAVANGIALHGGVIPVVGTFFVFSDFMKPAVRLAALMKLPVRYVWTHDAFRVGEDGPTHQPVEQEAQIRLLEQLKNHSGDNSMLVLRPADAAETTVAWKLALENNKTPTALILSRQNIKDLPAPQGMTRYEAAKEAEKGGYVVIDTEGTPDVVMVASGSEVSTCAEAADILSSEHGLAVRVVSIPSEGLFRLQTAAYQDAVLPADVPRVGLTAGLPSTLSGLVGNKGLSIGLDHFGYSAPAGVLDEKFGYTGPQVAEKVLAFLKG